MFICYYCNYSTDDQYAFVSHNLMPQHLNNYQRIERGGEIVNTKNEFIVKCNGCPKTFYDEKSYLDHIGLCLFNGFVKYCDEKYNAK